ncbi:MAG: hypothetical protein RIQ36_3 [Pseudomonadota bacterium]|jgi:hypothetical protein
MQFLNVYPKRLWATLNPVGAFEGQFTFDLEQYGLVTSDIVCDVTVCEDAVMAGQWKILVKPMFNVEMPHFDKFVETLNHYVFEVLQYTPNRSAPGKDLAMVKIFFDGIYFDMSGEDPVVQRIGADNTEK